MMRFRNQPKPSGFTLIEVMVALFVFALLASAAVALLTVSVDSENVAREKSDEQAILRRFTTILRQDMAHSLPRPARDDRGNRLPAFYTQDAVVIGLVRGGVQQLDEIGGQNAQRIEYRYEDGVLSRFAYDHIDGSIAGRETVLFDDVEDFAIRYRFENGVWQDDWRAERLIDQPVAIEMTILRKDSPQLRLTVPLGPGYRL